jgi:hypothetical protein
MDWLRSDLMTDHFKTSGALILMLGNFGMAWTGIVAISFGNPPLLQVPQK